MKHVWNAMAYGNKSKHVRYLTTKKIHGMEWVCKKKLVTNLSCILSDTSCIHQQAGILYFKKFHISKQMEFG